MTGEYVIQPLFKQYRNCLAQPEKQIGRRGIREQLALIGVDDILPVPIGFRERGIASRVKGLVTDRVET